MTDRRLPIADVAMQRRHARITTAYVLTLGMLALCFLASLGALIWRLVDWAAS